MSPRTVLRSTFPQTIILHGLMVIILKKRWSCVWTNMHWILLYSHFYSNFLQIWTHKILTFLPGKIVHLLAPDQCSSSQNLVQLILIEFAKIHMGDHVISNHCSWYLFISQGAKMKSVTMHFCRLIIGGDIYNTLVFLKAHFKNYCIMFVAALLIKFFMLHTCLHTCSWR